RNSTLWNRGLRPLSASSRVSVVAPRIFPRLIFLSENLPLLVQGLLAREDWVGGYQHAEVTEDAFVDRTEDRGGVHVATAQLLDDIKSPARIFVFRCRHRQRNQYFIGVQSRVQRA